MHTMLLRLRHWALVAALGLQAGLGIALTPAALAAPIEPNVLILNSYNREMHWTEGQTQGIIEIYKAAGINPVFYIEDMDWKRDPSPASLSLLRQLFQRRYANLPIDIIMTTDDAALEFALAYRHELFSNAPIVYSGVYPETSYRLTAGHSNVTGVQEVLDGFGTVEVIRQLQPDVRLIYLIYDNTESGLAAQEPLERAMANLNPRVDAIPLHSKSYQEIAAILRNAPEDSAAIMATYSRDSLGFVKDMERFLHLFSANSRIPIYTLYDFYVGNGAVGGSVLSGSLEGKKAAQLGLRVLAGENPGVVSYTDPFRHVMLFDYQQLLRYQLPLNLLPQDSELINDPQTFYSQHKRLIWTTLATFWLMVVVIVVLALNIKRRKVAETNLKQSNEELAATYEEVVASQEELQSQYEQLAAMQQALFVSEERHKLSIDGANDGLWDWDIKTNEVFFSDRCCSLLGIRSNRVKGFKKLLYRTSDSEESAKVLAALEEHLAGGSDYFITEFQISGEMGNTWVLCRGKAHFENGQAARMAGSLTDITERKSNEAKINYLAYHDQLTGLWNRTALNDKLAMLLENGNNSSPGAVLFIDIDNFKIVNDTYGHSFGDNLLVMISQILLRIVNNDGFVARMGGDEFVIILPEIHDRQAVGACAEKIKTFFCAPLQIAGNQVYVSFSIGLTIFPEDGQSAEDLLKNADFAMYQAKSGGKNQYVFYNRSMEAAMRKQVLLEQNLRESIGNDELHLWYQPFIELATGRVVGFEALLRWHSAEFGLVSPVNFIGLAEETGLIVPIGRKIIKDACQFITELAAEGYSDLQVTVNISVVQLLEADFVQTVKDILAETGAFPRSIGFEITETVFMESSSVFIDRLQCLKDMGITILIDDFGSGYSSLKYLHNLPIDVVKIDKSFIDRLDEPCAKNQLVKVIIDLAHQIQAAVVAEGVETNSQLQKLVEYQCEVAQGYLFSKPVPEAIVRSLLENGGRKVNLG